MPTASTSASSDISTATLGAWNVPQPTADFQTFDDGKSIQFKNGGAKWHYDTAATPLNVSGWIFEMANTTALINSGLYILFDISVQEGGNGAQDWQAEIAVNPSGGDPAAFDWQPMGGIIQLLAPADVTKRFQREYLVPSDIAAGSSIWIRMRIAGNKKIFDNNNFAAAYYRIKTGDNPVKISVSDSSVN